MHVVHYCVSVDIMVARCMEYHGQCNKRQLSLSKADGVLHAGIQGEE